MSMIEPLAAVLGTRKRDSTFVAISILPRILSGPLAAMLQSWLGWVGLYQFSFVLALGFVPFLVMIRKQTMSPDV